MNTRAFLRWASVNILLGGWDNYFATASNYYLYNSGREGSEKDFVASPYFTFIPWDYDNCLGIDYFGIRWQYANILDWPSNTIPYWKNRRSSRVPLVQNLLSNRDYLQYYMDHMEYVLDTMFSPKKIAAQIGQEFDGGLWDRVRQAAYLESTTADGRPFTGRKFSNHEVYWNGCRQHELRHGKAKIEGVVHYVRMRRDSARAQLKELRRTMPCAAGNGNFPRQWNRCHDRRDAIAAWAEPTPTVRGSGRRPGMFTHTTAHSTQNDTITGGTGRFAGASGTSRDTIRSGVVPVSAAWPTRRVTAAACGQTRYWAGPGPVAEPDAHRQPFSRSASSGACRRISCPQITS